jgi:hypothetical protein
MQKHPNISLGYSCLRNSVCNICAPALHPPTRSVPKNREAVLTSELFSCSGMDGTYADNTCEITDHGVCVYSNATVLFDLFLLAVRQDRLAANLPPNPRPSTGCSKILLDGTLSHVSAPSASRQIVVLVPWMSSDGFSVGRPAAGPPEPWPPLFIEPGYCLVVWGGEAVAVGGFVKGRPHLLVTNPGRPLIDRGILNDAVTTAVLEGRHG